MSREVKRVPLDFDWPLDKTWHGYLPPDDATYDDATGEYRLSPDGAMWEPFDPPTGDGWQVWQDVSEGSPITPVFPTAEALIDHLVTEGTAWDKGEGWRRAAAEQFVVAGWAPSFVGIPGVGLFRGANDADRIKAAR